MNKEKTKKNAQDVEKGKPAEAAPGPEATGEREQGGRSPRGQRRGQSPRKREVVQSEFLEKVLIIKRVTKVTKGGKKLSFSALVVVGDGKGQVGYSLGKAGEVATGIRKALNKAKKKMVRVSLKGKTIPHTIIGVCGAAEVLLKPASEGTGVIASGPVRAICDCVGIQDILTKCHRSNNPINVVKATMDGLMRLKRPKPQAVEQQVTPNASA